MIPRTAPLREALTGRRSGAFEQAGLHTVEDLLRHYPRRYYDRGELTDIASMPPGEHATLQLSVASVAARRTRQNKPFTVVTLTDGLARVTATFFNDKWLFKQLEAGQTVVVSGRVETFKGQRRFTQPEIAVTDADDLLDGTLGAVYPATAKLTSPTIRRAVRSILPIADLGPDPLPAAVLQQRGLLGQADALRLIHRPPDRDAVRPAVHRLRYEEAFATQVALAQRRAAALGEPARPRPRTAGRVLDAFDAALPFVLTAGQAAVAAEFEAELTSERPMHRLLQGEVGSGKTVVALRAMLQVVDAGGQAALLAPTEVLAQQHARSIRALLGPLAAAGELGGAEHATRVALLTGSQPATRRRRELLDAASGAAGIVVGTHALLEAHVQFADLGLVVVDEQHRFGVEQRDALRAKAAQPPHLLVMTATPIPRTVAMTVFGDLETSTLRELPAGRSPITTTVVPRLERPDWYARAWDRVREEVAAGRRAYVVCPRIDADTDEPGTPGAAYDDADLDAGDDAGRAGGGTGPDEEPDGDGRLELAVDGAVDRPPVAAVMPMVQELREGPLADLRVGYLHGRLVPEDKEEVMAGFTAGRIDVLVATTVIEVGVDVPEATVMVVLDADRFGISQLHQLRGRVGRGSDPGICLLVTTAPPGTAARERLDGVAATTDGFALARLDLEQRREGDVLGASQSGRRSSLRLLRLLRDEQLIAEAREDAAEVVADDPALAGNPALAELVASLTGQGDADYLAKA